MRDDGDRLLQQLGRERGEVTGATLRLRRRGEAARAAVLGERCNIDAVGEHDELVAPLGEGAELRHCRSEHGMRRINSLRDEDDLHPTSSRTRRAYSCGV